MKWRTSAGGIVIQTADNEFIVAGMGFTAVFTNNDSTRVTNILSADEVRYIKGKEIKGRRMNGDEDHQGRHIRFGVEALGIQKLRLYNSPKDISLIDKTGPP